jgi:CheY-like chemotaxis protein
MPSSAQKAPGERVAPGRVLIVEDDEAIRETLRELLEFEGFEVATAANGREAVSQLQRTERPCLILLDLMMPVMNGWEFLRKRREDLTIATIPVVVVFGLRSRNTPFSRRLPSR